ncbi:MAG: TA system VapC family ribonuclease toxin [Thermoanaerobaculia bacterium]
MFVVDTNILVYAAAPATREHVAARAALERWRSGVEPFYVTWPILYEFLRVVTHRTFSERPATIVEGWGFLEPLLDTPSLGVLAETERHGAILEELIRDYPAIAGNALHDFHTAVMMKEHGISEIRTADTDFHQFRFLRVVNPLVG